MWTAVLHAALAGPAHDDALRIDIGEPVVDAQALRWGNDTALLLRAADALWVVALDGQILDLLEPPGRQAIVVDLDHDGSPELLRCGAAGLDVVPVASGFGPPIRLSDRDCTSVSVGVDRDHPIAFAGAEGIYRLHDDDGVLQAQALEPQLADTTWVAADEDQLWIAARGARALVRWRDDRVEVTPVDGPLVAVAAHDGEVAWITDGPPTLFTAGGSNPLEATPDSLTMVSLAGGTPEPLVAAGNRWIYPNDLPIPVGRVSSADVDGDGLVDWIVAGPHGVTVHRGVAPPPTPDVHLGGVFPVITTWAARETEFVVHPSKGTIRDATGGPPGMSRRGSTFLVDSDENDVGRWYASVRVGPARWEGFIVDVWPTHATPTPSGPPGVDPSLAPRFTQTADQPARPWTMGRCAVGVGVAAGASRSGGLVWEDLGNPAVLASGSPAAGVVCPGGGDGLLQWVAGVDAAPWFRYTDIPTDRSHLFGVTAGLQLGGPRLRAGPYGSLGVTAIHVGGRAEAWLTDRVGIELRAGWLAPRAGVEGMVLVMRRFGQPSATQDVGRQVPPAHQIVDRVLEGGLEGTEVKAEVALDLAVVEP
jgi:hypothetical protein